MSSPGGLECSSFENCEEVTSDSRPGPVGLDLSTLENNDDVTPDCPSTPTGSERSAYEADARRVRNGDAHPLPVHPRSCALPAMQVQEACAMQQEQFHFPVAPAIPHTMTPPFCVQSPSSSVVHQAPDTQSLSTMSSPGGLKYSSFENCEEATSDSRPRPVGLDLSTLENNDDVTPVFLSTPTGSERSAYEADARRVRNGDAHEPMSYVSSETPRKEFRARQKHTAPAAGNVAKTPPPQQTVANKSKASSAFGK